MNLFHLIKKPISKYISATEFENVVSNDLICDWFSLVLPKKPHPLQPLFNKGIHHEASVIASIRQRLSLPLPKLSTGFIAQEYETVFPDHVSMHGPSVYERETLGLESVKGILPNLVPFLVKAIQEQQSQIKEQQDEITTLKAQITTLQAQLKALADATGHLVI